MLSFFQKCTNISQPYAVIHPVADHILNQLRGQLVNNMVWSYGPSWLLILKCCASVKDSLKSTGPPFIYKWLTAFLSCRSAYEYYSCISKQTYFLKRWNERNRQCQTAGKIMVAIPCNTGKPSCFFLNHCWGVTSCKITLC